MKKYSDNCGNYGELSKYYSFIFKGCCNYVDEKSWKELKFPYLYAFGKIRLQANEELSYMDCFEPFLHHLEYSSTVSEIFVEKWNELVKSADDCERASYIIKRVSEGDFKDNNCITETELARGALLAALRKEKPDKNKIRLKCSIKNIIEAMSLYRCEYEENDDLLEKYYEYNKALNAFFELEITDDKEEVIDSEVIKIIKEHCSKFKIKEELKKKLQELVDKKYYKIKNLDKEKEIHYIVVGNDVFCLSDNEGVCIRYYAEKLIGRKDDIIINIIQAATKRKEFEQYLREEKEDKKKEFVDFLTNYRHYQCNSGFDLNNIIEEIKGKNGKVWLEILQNINDAREDLSEEEKEEPTLLGEILVSNADEKYFITDDERMKKWVYLKGAKKIPRKSKDGHEYVFSEGPIAFPDPWDRPGRTMLTSESTLNRSTHVVSDPGTGKLRILTPIETERLQGFDDDWTNTGMPDRMRYFCMGNALVVPMVTRMGKVLDDIIENEN